MKKQSKFKLIQHGFGEKNVQSSISELGCRDFPRAMPWRCVANSIPSPISACDSPQMCSPEFIAESAATTPANEVIE